MAAVWKLAGEMHPDCGKGAKPGTGPTLLSLVSVNLCTHASFSPRTGVDYGHSTILQNIGPSCPQQAKRVPPCYKFPGDSV